MNQIDLFSDDKYKRPEIKENFTPLSNYWFEIRYRLGLSQMSVSIFETLYSHADHYNIYRKTLLKKILTKEGREPTEEEKAI